MFHRHRRQFVSRESALVLATAIIWAAVIVAVDADLSGTGYAADVVTVLVLSAFSSVVILASGLFALKRESDCC